ncbi:MFS general substrate transporter [Sistotremastrum suecicum HHB10207 ss-3]|uniref:MFS general substrate transporter n=1 Tax=Sistotremastrum suecicum HHB10207 ss-3 TaxID=1314776 RepID=A0A166AU51_9AGAM|nr:MFS general substrate transporter [Sistotremastrum suecicum HHB10207 ss-3]
MDSSSDEPNSLMSSISSEESQKHPDSHSRPPWSILAGGWIGSVQIALLFGIGLLSGVLSDRGHFRTLMWSSAVLYIVTNFTLSLTTANQYYAVLLSQGFGIGTALGLAWVPTFGTIGRLFPHHRDLAIGIAGSGASFGGIVQPILLNYLFQKSTLGFQNSVRVSAGINALLTLLGTILITRNAVSPQNSIKEKLNILSFFKEGPYVLLNLGFFCSEFGFLFPLIYLQLFARTRGIALGETFFTLSVWNGATAAGRVAILCLPARIHPITIISGACLGLSVCLFAYIPVRTFLDVMVVTSLGGLFYGAYCPHAVSASASQARNMEELGARIGIGTFIVAIATLCAPPILGALLADGFRWDTPIILAASTVLIGSTFFASAAILLRRQKLAHLIHMNTNS